jgi:hypothetical protein
MLIVEELHLLLTRSDGRTESAASVHRLFGENAAVIADLALHGRVVLTEEKNPAVQVVSAEPTGRPVLDASLARLTPLTGKRLQSLLMRSKLDPLAEVVESLVAQGVIVRGERGFFGMGALRTPESDPGPEMLVRARLAAVLAGSAAPTEVDVTLLAILQGLSAAHPILRNEAAGASAGQLKKRIEQLTAGSAAGDAVSKAVSTAVAAALMAALTPVYVATTMG